MKASSLIPEIRNLVGDSRERRVRQFIEKGYVPEFLTKFQQKITVSPSTSTSNSEPRLLEYFVFPDFFAIGEDDDHLLLPLNPKTLTEVYLKPNELVLPTPKMSKQIYDIAPVKLHAFTISPNSQSTELFIKINEKIKADKASHGNVLDKLCAGHKKDVVLSNLLTEKENKVGLYGWFGASGNLIQGLYCKHSADYVDYSHGLRPVLDACFLDGFVASLTRDIFPDPELSLLVHDEPLRFLSY